MDKSRMWLLAVVIVSIVQGMVFGQESRAVIPGLFGFGVDTPAGRGGQILKVTSLANEGPGSLRDALAVSGPRIIVFEVGGVIDLDRKELVLSEPFVTVAGQTAPSPGITLIRGTLSVVTHNVLIQHIRVRTGDAGAARGSGWEPDGLCVGGKDGHDVVIDHCSVSWAVDENLSISGPRYDGPEATGRRVTLNHCIIAEGLNRSTHAKGPHSKGSLIHDYCRDIAVIGNLYAHNVQRNPYFKAFTTGVIVNNLIYNPGTAAIQLGLVPQEWKETDIFPGTGRIAVVGNVLIYGQDTSSGVPLLSYWGDAYLEDNQAWNTDGKSVRMTKDKITILDQKPVWPEGLVPLRSDEVVKDILHHAGARPKDRDEADERILRDFRARKGRVIDSQEDVGGYPVSKSSKRDLDIPQDVETWLLKMARDLE